VAILPGPFAWVRSKPALDFRSELGFSLEDFDLFAQRHGSPLVTALGRFDVAAMTKAMGAPREALGGLVWMLDDGKWDPLVQTAARPYGESVFVLLRGNQVIMASDEEGLAAAAGAGSVENVLERNVALTLARQLDRDHAVNGLMQLRDINELDLLGPNATNDRWDAYRPPEALPKYVGYVSASLPPSKSEERAVLAVAYLDSGTARNAAAILGRILANGLSYSVANRQPWLVLYGDYRIDVVDSLVVVHYRPATSGQWNESASKANLPILRQYE
jgi:hypothetical protein